MNFNSAPKYPSWKDVPPPDGTIYRKIIVGDWERWFAWYPVKVHDKRVWLKTVYRRCITKYVDMDDWQHFEYGTIFDVLAE